MALGANVRFVSATLVGKMTQDKSNGWVGVARSGT